MFADGPHSDEPPKRDGDADKPGRRRTGFLKGSRHYSPSRKLPPPLWRPAEDARDVNLEMTPDDLDRSFKSRPPGAARERRHVGPAHERDFPETPGLGRLLRARLMPPGK